MLKSDNRIFTQNFELRTLNSQGFTLLEVMVAVVIMATVLVTLLGLKNRSMQDVLLAEHITTATMLADRMMATNKSFSPSEEEGDFSEDEELKNKDKYKEYTWKKTISKVPLPDFKTITEVRVAVLWKEGSRQEMVELLSYEAQ
ncbi:MAG: prepilin-type N-terminal cleavage/methylation domain-containing protein [Nitrospirota bacterium]